LSWLAPAVIGLGLVVLSCGSTLWDRPVEKIRQDLEHGKTDVLITLTPQQLSSAQLSLLGPGAEWNLGCLYAQLNNAAQAELLWRRSLMEEPAPWRDRAALDLYNAYAARRDWVKAQDMAQRLVSFSPQNLEYQRKLFEVYYFQKMDTLAWTIFSSWKPGAFSQAEETENQLFRGVLLARASKNDEASAILKSLIFDLPASELQFRLKSFFDEDPTRWSLIGAEGKQALEFQVLVYLSSTRDLTRWLSKQTFAPSFWNHRALIENLESAFKSSDHAEEGLRWLRRVGEPSDPGAQFAAAFSRGRFDRSLERWSSARKEFQRALSLAVTDDDKKKTGWNWLNAWVQLQPEKAMAPFLQVYSSTDDPGYYSDVFSDWMSQLVQDRRWTLLAAAWRDLGSRLDPDDQAALSFVLSRLASHQLVNLAQEGLTVTPNELLKNIIVSDPFSYEALVARAVLGEPLEWVTPPPQEPSFAEDSQAQTKLWDSMIAFGRAKEVANDVADDTKPLNPAWVDRVVPRLQAADQYRPSLKILYRLLRDPGRTLTKERALRLYPVAFGDLVKARAKAEGLDESLLLGLIREESTFDPSAKSWVGAQGLTQLMPQTAAETARRLHLKHFDLADPADNITLGARYLKTMIRSQGSVSLALMAYNAGGGRIRPWKTAMGHLPEEIFVEGVPITETRNYVKKIVTSTVLMGCLHFGQTPQQAVALIYPSFAP